MMARICPNYRFIQALWAFFWVMLLPLTQACAQISGPQPTLPTTQLTIQTESGRYDFTVELARALEEQQVGLMYRKSLAAHEGMLFLYESDQPLAMWMKNTLIPLDMLFIGSGGRVVDLHRGAVPGSLQTIRSRALASAVLEIRAGLIDRMGVKIGDRVRW